MTLEANIEIEAPMNQTVADRSRGMPEVRVYACSGDTERAQLAQEVAALLEAREVDLSRHGPAVAIDGCDARCASRKLEARGVSARAVSLDEVMQDSSLPETDVGRRALLSSILERLDAAARKRGRGGARRLPAPPRAKAQKRRHTRDDYLLALYTLGSRVVLCGALARYAPTIAAHVAGALSVSRPSAGEMLARLEDEGLVEQGARKEILLTAAGRRAAERVVRRHRVAERFFTDLLGYSAAESHDLALATRGGFDDTMIERIASTLSPPATCPHGWPLDPSQEPELAAHLVALGSVPLGSRATVVALVEDDAPQVERLHDAGLEPGAGVAVLSTPGGRFELSVAGRRRSLARHDAEAVLVRSQPVRS